MPNSAEILGRHFEKASFGGYKAADVEAFIEELRTFMAAQNKEIADLKRKLDDAVKKSSEYESKIESLKNTLLNAQIVADKTVADAKSEAEKILAEAKANASSSLSSTKIKVENMLGCAESEVAMRKEEAASIKAETYDFKLKLMKLYRAQIELINEIPAENLSNEAAGNENTEEDSAEETKEPEEAKKETAEEIVEEPAVVKPAPIETAEDKGKEPEKETAKPQDIKPEETQVKAEIGKTAEEAAPTLVKTVKLNLRYNEERGEYEPLGAKNDAEPGLFNLGRKKGKNGDGLKFGADYNVRTDSFKK